MLKLITSPQYVKVFGTQTFPEIGEVNEEPTGNCQLACVSNMSDLLKKTKRHEQRLKELVTIVNKHLFLCEVLPEQVKILQDVFKKAILFQKSYLHPNGYEMVVVLIHSSTLK